MGRQKNKKNPKGGKKHKSKASKDFRSSININNMPFKDEKDGQQYAKVINRLGGNRLNLKNELGLEIQGVIPGRFRKKVWFAADDTIMIQSRQFNEKEYDVIYRYSEAEVKVLKNLGHLNCFYKTNEEDNFNSHIEFTDKIEEDDDELFIDKKLSPKNNTKSNNIDFDDI